MEQRGRKTETGQVVGLPATRLEPPKQLTAPQAAIWRAVVSSKPLDWFHSGNNALLLAYCGAAGEEERLRGLLASYDTECLKDETGIKLYKELAKLWKSAADAMVSIGRQICVTPKSMTRNETAATAQKRAGKQRPWLEDGDDQS
jgi:hypothetical protein